MAVYKPLLAGQRTESFQVIFNIQDFLLKIFQGVVFEE